MFLCCRDLEPGLILIACQAWLQRGLKVADGLLTVGNAAQDYVLRTDESLSIWFGDRNALGNLRSVIPLMLAVKVGKTDMRVLKNDFLLNRLPFQFDILQV